MITRYTALAHGPLAIYGKCTCCMMHTLPYSLATVSKDCC